MQTIDLNGAWLLSPDWHSPHLSSLPETLFAKDEWLPAPVPGTVHTDLLAAGKIPDPFYGDNEWQVQWVAEIGWRYRRSFFVPAEFLSHDAVFLVAEGLDTFATIFINGQRVAETQNMFIPQRFEAKPYLHAGENAIEIRFDSPLQRAQELEMRYGKLPVALESYRVYARKAQYSFSWDWGPKLATSGIWRPLGLEGYRHLRLGDVFAQVQLDDDLQRAQVAVKIDVEKFTDTTGEFFVEMTGQDFQAQKQIHTSEKSFAVEFIIERPRLWWPNGFGDQPLYEVKVRASAGGQVVDERVIRCGIRKLELVREPDAGGKSFLFRVNNVPIFCKGANWIPADSFLPRISDEKYRSLLTMASETHMNTLRIWGGGIYEQKTFYDLCDELGLMVWQDFMFACGGYPEYPEFVDNVRREVATIVKQLRNHPCIVLWCGNNENEWIWNMEKQRPYREMPGITLFEKVIPEICAGLDPARPYWQSSPFGGENPNDTQQGDRHQWNIWSNWADPATVTKDRGRFLSEFGFQAPATLLTWKKFLPEKEQSSQSPFFEHHNKQVEGPERLYRFLAAYVKMPVDFEDFVYKAQLVQAEALKTMVEHWRREKFHTAGTLFWQLNDCWPVSSWAVIDSELQPKAAYWYARRFFAPILISLMPAGKYVEVWATNDTLASVKAVFELEVLDFFGEVRFSRRDEVLIPANTSLRLAAPVFDHLAKIDPRSTYVRVRLVENKTMLAENRYFFTRYKNLELPAPQLDCNFEKIGTSNWQVKIKTDRFVKSLALISPLVEVMPTENYFDLEAGAETAIAIKSSPEKQVLKSGDFQWKWLW